MCRSVDRYGNQSKKKSPRQPAKLPQKHRPPVEHAHHSPIPARRGKTTWEFLHAPANAGGKVEPEEDCHASICHHRQAFMRSTLLHRKDTNGKTSEQVAYCHRGKQTKKKQSKNTNGGPKQNAGPLHTRDRPVSSWPAKRLSQCRSTIGHGRNAVKCSREETQSTLQPFKAAWKWCPWPTWRSPSQMSCPTSSTP